MPVEIREISISASVEDQPPQPYAPEIDIKKLREEILAECADLIRKALERQWER
jgi:Family of unknown function (DUF5908)